MNLSVEKNKLAAFTETGHTSLKDTDWWTQNIGPVLFHNENTRKIIYFLVWRNFSLDHFYAPFPGQEGADDFKLFEQDTNTVFLNNMPLIYNKK